MKSDFRFSNLLGTVYSQGNLAFSEDGTKLLSPVGNRVSCFDLINSRSFTFNYEHRKNIARIALNANNTLLISVDTDGRAILVNFVSRTVLHHFNFRDTVHDIVFSPCGQYFAVACGRIVQVWHTPKAAERQFAPFVRHHVYAGHHADITGVSWSKDSRFLLTSAKDMSARVWSVSSEESGVATVLSGHRDAVVGAYFDNSQEKIYTVSRDGAIFEWEYRERNEEEQDEENAIFGWFISDRHYVRADARVKSCTFHAPSNVLVVGFSSGEFRLFELPNFALLQQLSMGTHSVATVSVNSTGEWLAFGSTAGQLLVYEWPSESYILKQQGHYDSMNAMAYSPDGARVVTAGADGKIKVWDMVSGFCLATFTEHVGAVTDVQFARRGHVMFSASHDGTVRAWDLVRFRNFRTFTAPSRVQFSCLAVDPSGEVVCAGSPDSYDVFVWSVQTAQLLDSLHGHEAPVSCVAFGAEGSVLASASWDKTIRLWNVFGRSQQSEPIEVSSDVQGLAMRPDAKEVAVATLDGHITVFDVASAKQVHTIDGRRDMLAGRYLQDRFAAKNSARSRFFTSLHYSFDGLTLVAGGRHNAICLYDVSNEVLLRRYTVSRNMALDGTQKFLNSSKITDAGTSIDLVDRDGEASDVEDRIDHSLPGSHAGDPSVRSTRPEIRVTAVRFSPTAHAFVAASTEGLLVYSTDAAVAFDPFDLDLDVTPAAVRELLGEKDLLTALVMAFRLNEQYLIHEVYEAVAHKDISLIAAALPAVYVARLLTFIGELMANDSAHMHFNLLWIRALLSAHGKYINENKHEFAPALRLVSRFLGRSAKDIVGTAKKSVYRVDYLEGASKLKTEDYMDTKSELNPSDSEGESDMGGWMGNPSDSEDENMTNPSDS